MTSRDVGPFAAIMATPFPHALKLGVKTGRDGGIAGIVFLDSRFPEVGPRDDAARDLVSALQRYFADGSNRQAFNQLSLAAVGTPFQCRVWTRLRDLPSAECLSYGELAHRLDSGARAVANACRANPLPIVVPCHRITAKSGIGGYMGRQEGWALELKHWLLRHEGFHE